MSSRSTGASLAAASAHHSSATAAANGNRPAPGAVVQNSTAAGAAGSSSARSGGAESGDNASGGGEFHKLLTHAGAQAKDGNASASQADGSGAKKHDRASNSKKTQSHASGSGPQVPGQGVLAPIAAAPVSSDRSTQVSPPGARTEASPVDRPTSGTGPSTAGSSTAQTDSKLASSAKAVSGGRSESGSKSGAGRTANRDAQRQSNSKPGDLRSKPIDLEAVAANSKSAGDSQGVPSSFESPKSAGQDSNTRADATPAAEPGAVATPQVAPLATSQSISAASATANAATGAQTSTGATASSSARAAGARSAPAHTTHDGRELLAQMPVAPSSHTVTHATLNAPIGTAPWNDQLGTQLIWMTHHKVDAATLHVSPPGLGPIEARIALHGGAASVWFGASHPDTRAALEQALPRLRAMFAMQGLALTDAGVSRDAPRRQQPPATSSVSALSSIKPIAQPAASSDASAADRGLVDLYA